MKQFFRNIINGIKSAFTQKPTPVVTTPKPVEVETPFEPELPVVGEKSKIKIGIIVGHEAKAPGAVVTSPINSNEYFVNTKIAKQIQEQAVKRGFQCEVIFRDKVAIKGAYTKAMSLGCDCVIELHFNAFNKKAYGTETLCTKFADDIAFAKIVQKHLVKCFERVGAGDRKHKPLTVNDRGGFSVHSFPTGVNCLVEPFFSDNPSEVALYLKKQDQYPKALVDAVEEWAQGLGLLREEPLSLPLN